MTNTMNDLMAIQASTDVLVAGLSEETWETVLDHDPTWTIKDAIVHLALYDYAACAMLEDAEENARVAVDKEGGVDEFKRSKKYRDCSGTEALEWWRVMRTRMDALFLAKDMKDRVNWAPGVPPMSVRSLLSARQMELWAHSVDIYQTLGKDIPVDDSIANTLFLSWQARANAYRINGVAMPKAPIFLDLVLPSGESWQRGDANEDNVVKGPAIDWALVAIRRANWHDTSLEIIGNAARQYADIVQTFAGEAAAAPMRKGGDD